MRLGGVSREAPFYNSTSENTGSYQNPYTYKKKGLSGRNRSKASLEDLLPEHRPLFERLMEKQREMQRNLEVIKQQHMSYTKYKAHIKTQNELFLKKQNLKEERMRLAFQRDIELNGDAIARRKIRRERFLKSSGGSARSSLSAAISRRSGTPVNPMIEQVVKPIMKFERLGSR
jgi:hypothetical protein